MSNDNKIKILFFGDIVGKIGRQAVCDYIKRSGDDCADFIIANVENASHGFGLTEKNYNQLSECGIDCFTSGNHIWDKKEIFNYIDCAEKLLRPLNYPKMVPGVGKKIFEKNGVKIGVINVLGRVFMTPVNPPFETIEQAVKELKQETSIIIIDFHAEATAEKICLANFAAKLGVSAFLGTHTHVQTADERIIDNMVYITDAGFCGASNSVIGMDIENSVKRMITAIPERYEVADDKIAQINAFEFVLDADTGHALDFKRIFCNIDYNEGEENGDEQCLD